MQRHRTKQGLPSLRAGYGVWTRGRYQPILILASALVLSACGGGGSNTGSDPAGKCVSGLNSGFAAAITDTPIPDVPVGEGGSDGGDGGGGGGGGGEGNGVGGGDGQYRLVSVTIEDSAGTVFGPATVDDEKGMVTFVHCNEPQLPARVTFEGKDVNATYYDEGLGKDVSFFEKTRLGLITNLAVNTGVTPLSEALYKRAQEIGRAQGDPNGWKNATIVGQAHAELLAVINDQLPDIYRLDDLKRLPASLSLEEDQEGSNALSDDQNGIYGAVLAGIARTGSTMLPTSTSPALDVADALVDDLTDANLNLKNAGGSLIGEATEIPYSYDALWTQAAVSTGESAQKAGSGSLLTSSVPLAYVREANPTAGSGEVQETQYVLRSNGELATEIKVNGVVSTVDPTPGVVYSQLMGFGSGLTVMALRRDGRGVLAFLTGSDGTSGVEISPPGANTFVELMDGGSPVLRLSDGSFVRHDGGQGFNVEPVPEGVLSFTFRPEFAGAVDSDDAALGADPNGADDNGLCVGSSRTGKVKLWRPVFTAGDIIPAYEPTVEEIVQVSSNQVVSLGLSSTGKLYHLDADHSVQFTEPGGGLSTVLDGDETRMLLRPGSAPVEIVAPKICSLRTPYVVACNGTAYKVEYQAFADAAGNVAGAGPISNLADLGIPTPVWRVRANRGNNLVFIGANGATYNADGSPATLSLQNDTNQQPSTEQPS